MLCVCARVCERKEVIRIQVVLPALIRVLRGKTVWLIGANEALLAEQPMARERCSLPQLRAPDGGCRRSIPDSGSDYQLINAAC